eukprot:TRINITY_DN10825_c0_g1_i1.p1 TRINITY_DN10825_c0_g1~~TRINITY_DN10825_c0_g1_i1.p1  ORF type:complete len:172 (+),score=25.27 TRINITY_DN10825_c0_g1_i1:71-517(+)
MKRTNAGQLIGADEKRRRTSWTASTEAWLDVGDTVRWMSKLGTVQSTIGSKYRIAFGGEEVIDLEPSALEVIEKRVYFGDEGEFDEAVHSCIKRGWRVCVVVPRSTDRLLEDWNVQRRCSGSSICRSSWNGHCRSSSFRRSSSICRNS